MEILSANSTHRWYTFYISQRQVWHNWCRFSSTSWRNQKCIFKKSTKKTKLDKLRVRPDHSHCRNAVWICMYCMYTHDIVIHCVSKRHLISDHSFGKCTYFHNSFAIKFLTKFLHIHTCTCYKSFCLTLTALIHYVRKCCLLQWRLSSFILPYIGPDLNPTTTS